MIGASVVTKQIAL